MLEIAVIAIIILFFLAAGFYLKARRLSMELEEAVSKKQALSTKYGQMSQEFMPFLEAYPYDPQNFRFLGEPVDGVQFEESGIHFIEFKAGDSRLSARQKKIKELVDGGKVTFEEIRIPPKKVNKHI